MTRMMRGLEAKSYKRKAAGIENVQPEEEEPEG